MKKMIKIILLIFIIAVATVFIINFFVKVTTKKKIITESQATKLDNVDCILVLGAGIWGDKPSPMLEDRLLQAYHLYRSLYIANRLGVEAYGVGSDPRKYVGAIYREAREILARDKDFIKCIFKPEPTYLGETIPVSGNGNITNDK